VVKHLDSKNVKAYQKDAERYKNSLPYHKTLDTPAQLVPLFALYHNLLNFVLPMCSTLERPNPEVPVTNSTNIVDISGVGLTQFWNLKSHMQDASVLATAHYPETLDRIYVSNTEVSLFFILLSLADHRGTGFLSHCLGLDQAMVRSGHRVQDIHPWQTRSQINAFDLYKPGRLS
jgi:hypothetical protein